MLAPFMLAPLVLLLALFFAPSVQADESWRVPAGCPDRDDAEERLRALNADPALLEHGNARVWIEFVGSGELRARVKLRHADRSETRVLYDRSCDALTEAALLVISLSFDGERAQPLRGPERTETSVWPRALSVAVLGRFDSGSLPRPTFGAGGSLRYRVARFTGELEGVYYVLRDYERRGLSGRFGLTTGSARACITVVGGFAPCVALELGKADAISTNTADYRYARGLWATALVGASYTLGTFRRLAPIADLELGFPLQHPAFDIEGAGTFFEPRSVIVRASLRLAIELFSRP